MPAKPHYKMAPELSLVLHECEFDNMKIQMQPLVLWNLLLHYESLYEKYSVASSRIKNCIETLKLSVVRTKDIDPFLAYKVNKKQIIVDRKSGWKYDDDLNKNKVDELEDKIENGKKSDMEIEKNENENLIKRSDDAINEAMLGDVVKWSDVLQFIHKEHGLAPTDDAVPHVPLTQVLHIYVLICMIYEWTTLCIWKDVYLCNYMYLYTYTCIVISNVPLTQIYSYIYTYMNIMFIYVLIKALKLL